MKTKGEAKKPCGLHLRELTMEGVQGGGGDNVRREATSNGDSGGQERESVWVIGRAQWNIPPRMKPTCLSSGWHQPPPPGIHRRCMCNPARHIDSHAIATYSEGLPSEAANHLANTASTAPATAHTPCSTSPHHPHSFDVTGSMRAPMHVVVSKQ